uniref:Uncharacterized protein n=1 Tax=Solanum tuberosum TaxID=4113 RepID=M1D175_SOLTU
MTGSHWNGGNRTLAVLAHCRSHLTSVGARSASQTRPILTALQPTMLKLICAPQVPTQTILECFCLMFWVYSCRLILLTGWLGLFTSGEGHNNKQETVKYEDQCSNSYCSNIELGSQSPIRCQTKQTSGDMFDGFQEDKRKYSKSLGVLSSAFLSCTVTFTISSGPPRDFKENLPCLSNLIR